MEWKFLQADDLSNFRRKARNTLRKEPAWARVKISPERQLIASVHRKIRMKRCRTLWRSQNFLPMIRHSSFRPPKCKMRETGGPRARSDDGQCLPRLQERDKRRGIGCVNSPIPVARRDPRGGITQPSLCLFFLSVLS